MTNATILAIPKAVSYETNYCSEHGNSLTLFSFTGLIYAFLKQQIACRNFFRKLFV